MFRNRSRTMKKTNLKIGDLDLVSPFLLAPLAGITDQAMRSLCCEAGASLTYTEMVSAKGLWYGDARTADLLAIADNEGPVAYQLFGSEPVVLSHAIYELSEAEDRDLQGATATDTAADEGPDVLTDPAADEGLVAAKIPGPPPKPWPGYPNDRRPVLFDLNAGCPVPKIVKNGEGSALLKDPDLLYDCVRAMCRAADDVAEATGIRRPVTAKIRKGFSRDEDLAVENAKAIEAAGAAAVTVHGRCREQYYEGKADWECIARVKDILTIPVIGNGDVMCGEDAIRMMKETGCDGVMIARGALGNPWIFTEANELYRLWIDEGAVDPAGAPSTPTWPQGAHPTGEDRIEKLLEHIDLAVRYKGEHTAVREMRKHVGWYIKGMHGATEIRRKVNIIDDVDELKETVRSLLR